MGTVTVMAFKTPDEIQRERDRRERERTLNRIADAAFDAAAGECGPQQAHSSRAEKRPRRPGLTIGRIDSGVARSAA